MGSGVTCQRFLLFMAKLVIFDVKFRIESTWRPFQDHAQPNFKFLAENTSRPSEKSLRLRWLQSKLYEYDV
jgi:hypothetical protein